MSDPATTPARNNAMMPPATSPASVHSAAPTASRFEFPVINDTKKPPDSTKPSASMKPASAETPAANACCDRSKRIIGQRSADDRVSAGVEEIDGQPADIPGDEPELGLHGQAEEKIDAAEHRDRSEEHTSELQSLMRISYAVFCLKKKNKKK